MDGCRKPFKCGSKGDIISYSNLFKEIIEYVTNSDLSDGALFSVFKSLVWTMAYGVNSP